MNRSSRQRVHIEHDLVGYIPVDELRERLGELDRRKPVYVMCQSGLRSYIACRMLSAYGFDCHNLAGGIAFASHVHPELIIK